VLAMLIERNNPIVGTNSCEYFFSLLGLNFGMVGMMPRRRDFF
jgi:hypothetical protein